MEEELRAKIDQACRTAEEFTKLYYESLDKRRYLMSRLYMDTAILIWNGNGIEGKDQIQNFWTELPSSDHSVITLDAQPITVANQLTFLVKVSGQVKYQDKAPKTFNQNFLITALGDKWKIVSDCFRTQEALEN
ncbi:PREDICTED: NTF2-related export protein isoform X2 [Ceratosolen solmsi marchali]|uniref:NTF2-related export protein n=1 Tax=Ceratosolen solmsi marchali TaxID=326594 RepID=A0AAJ6YQN0_9HYME|nr:PREDICTED: NTF2-related export protein isoform X2 [Ceratosolen solmsi marchali]